MYLSDEYKTKAIKISHDRLSARLDIATFETVAANVSVTKGTQLKFKAFVANVSS